MTVAGAFQRGAFQFGAFQEGPAPDIAAGVGRPRRPRRHRWFVEIDGEEFEVATEAEALRLLAEARKTAQEAAAIAAEASVASEAPEKAPVVPRIVASPALQPIIAQPLQETRDAISEIYRLAFYAAAHQELQRREAARLAAQQAAQNAQDEQDLLAIMAASDAAALQRLQAIMQFVNTLPRGNQWQRPQN